MKHKAHSVQNKTAAARNHSAMPPDNHIADYWLERLASACKQAHVDTACLGITNHGSSIAVSYSHSAAPDHSSANPYPAFCVAKLFTSTLIALLVMQGKLQFDAEITGLLPATSTAGVASTVLHGVTVAQLLAHTHGLCALGLDAAPVQADGFIDYEHVLCLLHSSGRMFAPGKFYSYGMAGYVVLGSIIEHITRQTYNQVLHQQILLPIATRGTHLPDVGTCTASRPICPSSGRGLHLTPGDLLAFASGFLTPLARVLNLPDALLAQIFTTRKLLPGWSPTIAGSCYGWKNFANNWYGQNGIDKQHLMYVRINRATETAI
jgi:CubicO group peptidase (beta-lactamase class C family)